MNCPLDPHEGGVTNTPILQMRKQRHRESNHLTQPHGAKVQAAWPPARGGHRRRPGTLGREVVPAPQPRSLRTLAARPQALLPAPGGSRSGVFDFLMEGAGHVGLKGHPQTWHALESLRKKRMTGVELTQILLFFQ